MKLLELTEFLVKNLVTDPETVSLKQFEDGEFIIIEVLVDEKDMGMIIGKAGNTANAIRTLVQASSYIHDNKKVRININSL